MSKSYTVAGNSEDPQHVTVGFTADGSGNFSANLTLKEAGDFWASLNQLVETTHYGVPTLVSLTHDGKTYTTKMRPDEIAEFANLVRGIILGNTVILSRNANPEGVQS